MKKFLMGVVVGLLLAIAVFVWVKGSLTEKEEAAIEEAAVTLKGVTARAAKEVAEETVDFYKKVKDYTFNEKDDYVEKAEARIQKLDPKLTALDDKLEQTAAGAKEELQNTLDRLKEKRNELDAKLTALKESSEVSWEEMKEGFTKAMKDLENAYKRAAAEFKKEEVHGKQEEKDQ
jgi:MFS superfamily sulfate permease-like transporter